MPYENGKAEWEYLTKNDKSKSEYLTQRINRNALQKKTNRHDLPEWNSGHLTTKKTSARYNTAQHTTADKYPSATAQNRQGIIRPTTTARGKRKLRALATMEERTTRRGESRPASYTSKPYPTSSTMLPRGRLRSLPLVKGTIQYVHLSLIHI